MTAERPSDPELPTPPSRAKDWLHTLLAGCLLTFAAIGFIVKQPALFFSLNNAVSDAQIRWLPHSPVSQLPIIVEIDERSLAAYGQWPWPRYRVAALLGKLHEQGAAAIGIDSLFVEKDRTSPVAIQQMFEKDFQQTLPLSSLTETNRDFDAILGRQLTTGPYVLSHFFTFNLTNNQQNCLPKSANGAWLGNETTDSVIGAGLHHAKGILCNIPIIQQAAFSGFINTSADHDGIYRKTPLVIEHGGKPYPSLALQTYLIAEKIDQFVLTPGDDGLELKFDGKLAPLDSNGNLRIKFPLDNQGFIKLSATDVLSGQVDSAKIKGKIVFVGVSAAGLHEIRPTPNNSQFLGVEFHAAIVDNLAKNDFLQRPTSSSAIEIAVSALIGIGIFAGLANAGVITSVIVPALLILALFAGSQLILQSSGIIISPGLPILITFLSLLTLSIIKYAREYRRAKEMTLQVARTQEGIIGSFCSMSEYRDPETGAHILRTQTYIKALAKHLQNHPKFKAELTDETIELLFKAAPLHDIGKIGIRDHVLLKNDKLDESEFLIMKSHPQIGADMIASVAKQIGWNPFMKIAYQIALYHQEKWDGSGYPHGLKGEAIPFPARFMALADVYDALISKRVYKPAFPHQKAVKLIIEGKSKHFDPLLVEAFEAIHEEFKTIALRYSDSDEQRDSLLANED